MSHNRIITYNMTLDVEPVTFDSDKLYLCCAERFPRELKQNVDLIISNMAFVYMAGQSLALENCLQSLSVGGEAFLSVGWGKQDSFIPGFAERMRNQYQRMQKLNNEEVIELEVHSNLDGSHPLTYVTKKPNGTDNDFYFPGAFVHIRKIKSL